MLLCSDITGTVESLRPGQEDFITQQQSRMWALIMKQHRASESPRCTLSSCPHWLQQIVNFLVQSSCQKTTKVFYIFANPQTRSHMYDISVPDGFDPSAWWEGFQASEATTLERRTCSVSSAGPEESWQRRDSLSEYFCVSVSCQQNKILLIFQFNLKYLKTETTALGSIQTAGLTAFQHLYTWNHWMFLTRRWHVVFVSKPNRTLSTNINVMFQHFSRFAEAHTANFSLWQFDCDIKNGRKPVEEETNWMDDLV